jgi:formate dehydrogenase gamma subunit
MSQNIRILRFDIARRIEHLVLILSFTTLGVTGLVQKYAFAGVSEFIIRLLGGIEPTRIIHHVAAAIFLLEAVYHLIVLGYKLYILRVEATMLPGGKDIRDVIQFMGYNLGLTKDHPRMGRYNFAEKAEYWAMLWGLVLMGLTGILLWNPIAATNLLPGQIIPAAKSAHGYEAVLAVLAIILWHFYNVHLKKWNWSMIKGTLSKEEMEEEHSLELEAIEAGEKPTPISPAERSKRLRIFIPLTSVVSVVLVVGIVRFLTFENTAITTIPPASNVAAYQRQTATPLPTSAPTATRAPTPTAAPSSQQPTAAPSGGSAATWDSSIGMLFQDNCASCHGSAAMGGLNVTTYANTMKGGTSGAMINAGSPDSSLLIKKMQSGHGKVFNDADLTSISAWIKAGAPEK